MKLKEMFTGLRNLVGSPRFFRRLVLLWSVTILSFWSFFLMDVALLTAITSSGVAVVSLIFGILTSVIAFYQWHRKADDDKERESRK